MPVKLKPDLGTPCHVAFGFLGPILGYEWHFILIYSLKQVGDYLFSKEPWEETAGDIVEFTIAFVVGIVVKKILTLVGLIF